MSLIHQEKPCKNPARMTIQFFYEQGSKCTQDAVNFLGALCDLAMGVLVWTVGTPFPEAVPGPSINDLMDPPYSKARRTLLVENGRTLLVVAFQDTGDEKRELRWPPDSISHRDFRNLQFLSHHVIGGPRALDMDFILVDTTPGGPAIDLSDLPKHVRYVHRENVGFDMCSYKIGLALVRPREYQYIVLMNGSVRGPFAGSSLDFLAAFKRLLTPDVPVVGTTVACCHSVHIQSMFYMVNSIGAELLNLGPRVLSYPH